MEKFTKNFRLICGILLVLCCALPFFHFVNDYTGFDYVFAQGFQKSAMLSICQILFGAGILIYAGIVNFASPEKEKNWLILGRILVAVGILSFLKKHSVYLENIKIGLFIEMFLCAILFFEKKISRWFSKLK